MQEHGYMFYSILGISYVILAFYILTLQNTLLLISKKNRKINPYTFWLLMIPYFAAFWNFVITYKLTNSILAEFTSRNIDIEKKPTFKTGFIQSCMGAIIVITVFPAKYNRFFLIPFGIAFILGNIFMIKYWIEVNEYRKKLKFIKDLPVYE
jgi:hypothetical protein